MDRNTLTGLVLIGLILVVFSLYTQNKNEEEKNQNNEQVENTNRSSNNSITDTSINVNNKFVEVDSTKANSTHINDSLTKNKENNSIKIGEIITKETNKFIITFNSKGGYVSSVRLKDYRTYQDYINSNNTPLTLFEDGDHCNQLRYTINNSNFYSTDQVWTIEKNIGNLIVFSLPVKNGKIIQSYELKENDFDLNYSVQIENIDELSNDNVSLIWMNSFKKTERLLSEQRRVSTIYYNDKEEGVDYLSESSDDYISAENDISWVAYKQSYFSSILKPSSPFKKDVSNLKIENFGEGDHREFSHIKYYHSHLKFPMNNGRIDFNWYFGPNDYEILSQYNEDYDDILNLGWGLFRWINIYAVQPIFKWILDSGINAGISILLLTIILKILLMPVQWKMFVSSIKMRILRPEIEKLNAKFPNKEDAMKKQMEMMSLYRDTGASPLAGCIPMLIQMPILFAVFRFFPASFDLRQRSFLWAEDLSSYDSILDFGFHIPLYGDHISLFTLLMAATTLSYTIMNSGNMQQPTQPGMPNMKVIMYIFPIMMIFFFNDYSSGLSYYYFISTLLSIVIMLAIKYMIVDEEKLKVKMAQRQEKSKETPKKKSKFQAKLEEMQKKQQEMLKNRKR